MLTGNTIEARFSAAKLAKFCCMAAQKKGGVYLNVTSKGRYALRVMLDLAQHPEDGYISLKTIADRQGISMKYLEMIVGNLKKARLVDSTRGKDGGYKLNRSPGDYSVGDILRCIEDNLAPVACIKAGSINCENAAGCMTVPMWKEIGRASCRERV